MEIYRVGGAVRDQLLGLPVKDIDWVVVGAMPQQMIDLGYQQVGRDFPVFLHPETKQEYALARTERKTAAGYTGFAVHADPDVTLEQDLARRDLTINAIAEDDQGNIIDPYQGRVDLENKVLRHVTQAFVEDPLRILRLARFAARFFPLGFRIADKTLALMREMVASGEMKSLVAERVWTETERALSEADPLAYFNVLDECHALSQVFPELASTWQLGVPTAMDFMASLAKTSTSTEQRFAALSSHLSSDQLHAMASRLRISKSYTQLTELFIRYGENVHGVMSLSAEQQLSLLESLDALRRPERLESLLSLCQSHWCLSHPETSSYPQSAYLQAAIEKIKSINAQELRDQGLSGQEIAEALQEKRIIALKEAKPS